MRKTMLAGLLCASGLVAATPAWTETWCLRQPGSQSQVCVLSSTRDCTMAATYGAFGGICAREALGPRPKTDQRRIDRKSARERQVRQGRQDQWWW
jgi:hypothetical protein